MPPARNFASVLVPMLGLSKFGWLWTWGYWIMVNRLKSALGVGGGNHKGRSTVRFFESCKNHHYVENTGVGGNLKSSDLCPPSHHAEVRERPSRDRTGIGAQLIPFLARNKQTCRVCLIILTKGLTTQVDFNM